MILHKCNIISSIKRTKTVQHERKKIYQYVHGIIYIAIQMQGESQAAAECGAWRDAVEQSPKRSGQVGPRPAAGLTFSPLPQARSGLENNKHRTLFVFFFRTRVFCDREI